MASGMGGGGLSRREGTEADENEGRRGGIGGTERSHRKAEGRGVPGDGLFGGRPGCGASLCSSATAAARATARQLSAHLPLRHVRACAGCVEEKRGKGERGERSRSPGEEKTVSAAPGLRGCGRFSRKKWDPQQKQRGTERLWDFGSLSRSQGRTMRDKRKAPNHGVRATGRRRVCAGAGGERAGSRAEVGWRAGGCMGGWGGARGDEPPTRRERERATRRRSDEDKVHKMIKAGMDAGHGRGTSASFTREQARGTDRSER